MVFWMKSLRYKSKYKSRCKDCEELCEFAHYKTGFCILPDEFGHAYPELFGKYIPSDNLEYLEYLYDKSHTTI